jgi:iron complex transport system ATP-binding protein
MAPHAARIEVDDLHAALGGRPVLHGVSLTVQPGEVLGVLGPNGSGKSTLLRCIAGLLAPQRGRVRLDGDEVSRLPVRELARRLALQSQEAPAALGHSVRDVVEMGRLAHRRLFGADVAHDRQVVDDCLAQFDLLALADRVIDSLSGGERQRALIARALAQQPRGLLLDEPTNHLDVRHQFAVLDRVRTLGLTVVVTLHDLALAARVCDRIVLLREGRVAALGTPAEALTPERIAQVYGVGAEVDAAADGRLRVHLHPLHEAAGEAPAASRESS